MTTFRLISLPAHAAVEMMLGLALMAAPFALGLGPAAVVAAFALGALVVGVAFSTPDETGGGVAAHHANDIGLAAGMLMAAAALAFASQPAGAAVLALGALAQATLLLTTRYSSR